MRRAHVLTLAAALALGVVPGEAHAQLSGSRDLHWAGSRLSVEGFFTRYRLTADRGGGRLKHQAIGGRIMWALAPRTDADRGTVAARTSVGGFIIHTPEPETDLRTSHYGAQLDFQVLRTPLADRIDPLLSLGVGAFRTEGSDVRVTQLPGTLIPPLVDGRLVAGDREGRVMGVDLVRRSTTSLALTPGVGVSVGVAPGFALRGDVRDALVFRAGVRHHIEVSAGLRVTL